MDLAGTLAELGADTQGLVLRRQLRSAGLSNAGLARALEAGRLVRVRPRVYALAALAPTPRFVVTPSGVDPGYVARVRAALMSLGGSATACLRTAAALHGWGMLVEPGVVEVAVPHGRSGVTARGVRAVQRRSAASQRRVVLAGTAPLRTTSSVQTVVDCALDLPLLHAVVLCDSALRARDVTVEELHLAAGRLAGVRDAHRVRRVLELCDPESGSVLESVLRVHMVLGGIDGFTTQRVVRDLPGAVVRVDFCFEAHGLVVEVDGARWHQEPARDRARDNALAGLGWRVLRFTWSEVLHDTPRVLQDVRDALACGRPSLHLRATWADEAA